MVITTDPKSLAFYNGILAAFFLQGELRSSGDKFIFALFLIATLLWILYILKPGELVKKSLYYYSWIQLLGVGLFAAYTAYTNIGTKGAPLFLVLVGLLAPLAFFGITALIVRYTIINTKAR